ncbi:MAG: thioesterase family protein [Acidimicrobiales bacterium]
MHVAVVGSGARAGEWATRFLASGFDVVANDPTVADTVTICWPLADRMGLFPGASPDRLRISDDPAVIAGARLVQVVGDAPVPVTDGLVATDRTAYAHSPIHLLPLVELRAETDADHERERLAELAALYASMGMAPRTADSHPLERWRLGPGLVELTNGDHESILAVMRALRATGQPIGLVVADHEAKRFASDAAAPWAPGDVVEAPLRLYRTTVEPDWVDYNGHMTEAAYLTAAGWASDKLFRYIGDDEAYRAAGHSFYTVETHIHYLLEVDVHEPIEFTTQVLGVDAKRLHFVHEMFHGDTGAMLASVEQMLVHVDMAAGRSVALLPNVAAALAAIAKAHAHLPVPTRVGSVMQLPPKKP